MVTLHVRVMLLSDIYATVGYSQGRASATLIQALNGPEAGDLLLELGDLHRTSLWENIILKTKGSPQAPQFPATEGSPDPEPSSSSASSETLPGLPNAALTNGAQDPPASPIIVLPQMDTTPSKDADPKECNIKALKHIATQLPNALAPFFQCKCNTCSVITYRC